VFPLVVTTLLAVTPDWTAAFPPDSAASFLPQGLRVAMVVTGGAHTPDGDQAKEAFAQALRKSLDLRLVLTDEPLGDVSTLSDAELTSRASKYAVNAVVILRVFTTEGGKPPLAVGSVFGSDGALLSSFSTTRGAPLVRNTQSVAVSSATVDAVSSTLKESESKRPVTPGRGRSLEPEEIPADAPRVFVTVAEKEDSGLRPELHRVATGTISGYRITVDGFVCTLPCKEEVALPDMQFYVGGTGVMPSEPFRLSSMTRGGRVDLKVKSGSLSSWTLGLVGVSLGIPTIIGSVAMLVAGSRDTGLAVGGVILLVAGGLMTGFGIPGMSRNTTTVSQAEN
jgi:hypothetical protein